MKDLTPKAMRCPAGYCPSVGQLEDGRLLIVGARADQKAHDADIGMAANEQAIIIDPALLDDVPRRWRTIDSAPSDGTKIDLLFPYPRGRVVNAYWKGDLGFTWVWRRATWDDSGNLLPEDRWSISSSPNMEPLAWMPAVSDDFPLPPTDREGA